MTAVTIQAGQPARTGAVGPHDIDCTVTILVPGIDDKTTIRAPARVFTIARAEGQATFIGAVGLDGVNIKTAAFLASECNTVALRTPGRCRIVLSARGQTSRFAGENIGNKNMRVALSVRDKCNTSAIGTPGRVTVDPPAVGNPLANPAAGADQVDFRVAILGQGQGNLPLVRRHAPGDIESRLVGELGFLAGVNLLAVEIRIVGPVGGEQDLFAARREIRVE